MRISISDESGEERIEFIVQNNGTFAKISYPISFIKVEKGRFDNCENGTDVLDVLEKIAEDDSLLNLRK